MAWINPNIPEGYNFIKDTLKFYVYQHGDILSRATDNFYYDYTSGANKADVIGDIRNYSFSSSGNSNMATVHGENQIATKGRILSWFPIMTIRVNTTTNPITVSYSNDSEKTAFTTYPYFNWWYQINNAEKIIITNDTNWAESKATEFSTLVSALQYIYDWYANVNIYVDDELWIRAGTDPTYTSNGGGATHIAKRTGQLKDLSSYTSDILMVSGGGGGGLIVGETDYSGKEAGGISGSGDNSAGQTTGNAFGLGESGTGVSGGGSGLYGGYKGTSSKSGGAGSGYIGNSLLSNKKMVGYNVPTSSAEGTKTESVNVYDSNYVAEKPKAGNGHVRIKYLTDGIIRFKNAIVFPNDDYEVKGKNTENTYAIGQLKQTFASNNTWFLIWETNGYIALQFNASSSWNMKLASGKYIVDGDEREDWLWGMNNATDPLYPCHLSGGYIGSSWSLEAKTIGNDTYRNDCYTGGTEEHPCIIVSTITGLEVYKDGVKVMVR